MSKRFQVPVSTRVLVKVNNFSELELEHWISGNLDFQLLFYSVHGKESRVNNMCTERSLITAGRVEIFEDRQIPLTD